MVQFDIPTAKSVEVVVDHDGVFWVNVDGEKTVRIGHSKTITVETPDDFSYIWGEEPEHKPEQEPYFNSVPMGELISACRQLQGAQADMRSMGFSTEKQREAEKYATTIMISMALDIKKLANG